MPSSPSAGGLGRGCPVVAVLLAVRAPHREAVARTACAPGAAVGGGRAGRRRRGSGRSRTAAARPCSARAAPSRAPCRRDRAWRPCRTRTPPWSPARLPGRGEQLVPALEAARLLHELRLDRDRVALAQVAEPHDALALVARLGRVARRPLGHVHHRRDERERVQHRAGRTGAGASVGDGDGDDLPAPVRIQQGRRVGASVGRLLLAPAERAGAMATTASTATAVRRQSRRCTETRASMRSEGSCLTDRRAWQRRSRRLAFSD